MQPPFLLDYYNRHHIIRIIKILILEIIHELRMNHIRLPIRGMNPGIPVKESPQPAIINHLIDDQLIRKFSADLRPRLFRRLLSVNKHRLRRITPTDRIVISDIPIKSSIRQIAAIKRQAIKLTFYK